MVLVGLDITHYKATFKKAEAHTLFYIGECIYGNTGAEIRELFDGFNVDFDHFKKYIQQIDVPSLVESIIVVNNPEYLKNAQEHFRSENHLVLLKPNNEELTETLHRFERQKGYQLLERNVKNGEHVPWTIVNYFTTQQKEGFYFEQVGTQRKGMNNNFWSRFCNGEKHFFAQKEDFEFAFSCLEPRNYDTEESMAQKIETFKKSFIDNFEEGASFLSVSY